MSDDLVKILRADDGDWRTDQAADRIEELEGKLAEATEALEGVRSFTRDLGLYADQGHTLAPALRKACNTLTKLKGEQ